MIKYLGSKRRLLKLISSTAESFHPEARTFLDLFSGTSRVGHAMKRRGLRVVANDYLRFAHTLAGCYVGADRATVENEVSRALDELRAQKPRADWFTKAVAEDARYLHPKNAAKIESMREHVDRLELSEAARAVVLTSLMEAADRVDSTCGVQMAYLKQWAPRAHNDVELRFPDVLEGEGRAILGRAEDVAGQVSCEIAYLDPPYNQHSYLGNYHVWESLIAWDAPETYGVANKRVECREKKSDFNMKRAAKDAMTRVVEQLDAELIVVSFNNEGYLSQDELTALLSTRGEVSVTAKDYPRYVGAQIGIYNPSGQKVGAVSHLANKELLFVVETPALMKRRARAPRRANL